MPSLQKVKDLIQQIRACKTAALERDLVNKECAKIRDTLSLEHNDIRHINVAKLLYIFMLGYPAHFGQMECLKLISSNSFTDKKIGYLGSSLLLDERQDVHLLLTNSIKKEFNHSSQYVVGLALSTLGCILSAEMGRDLSTEVEKLFSHKHSYVRKKAALCAVRIVSKDGDLAENFKSSVKKLLSDRNHGVVLGGVALGTVICQKRPEFLEDLRHNVSHLVKLMRTLLQTTHAPDHDVQGVTDPFLQVNILTFLRTLGKGDETSTESMNDILAQVATNTDSGRNVGNAVLYETVKTIMEIQAEKGLRVLAINILGRFLLNSDKNIRYVALNTLLKSVHTADGPAIQRHRTTVLDCLKDPDISIRRRAVELCFALITKDNIETLLTEILALLETAPEELQMYVISNIFIPIERYAPSQEWHVNTVLDLIRTAGGFIRDDQVSSIIALFASQTEYHPVISAKLYKAVREDASLQPVVQVSVWCLGEFGETLTTQEPKIEETEIISTLNELMHSTLLNSMSKVFTFNSLMKLSVRLKQQSNIDLIKCILANYTNNMDAELQQRAVEYSTLFKQYDYLRANLLEEIPLKVTENEDGTGEETSLDVKNPKNVAPAKKPQEMDTLLGILGPSDPVPQPTAMNGVDTNNILLDILGTGPVLPTTQETPVNGNDLDSLLGMTTLVADTSTHIPSITAYEKNDICITFSFEKNPSNPGSFKIKMQAKNTTAFVEITEFLFQAAVPKGFEIKMDQPDSNIIPAQAQIEQLMTIMNPSKAPVKMLIRFSYVMNGTKTEDQAQVSNFPEELTN
ncbi:AP-1 complex subunit gamma-1 isoform X2 [Oopsacas minuta]|uniref:AP-1 complex subunit gamma n=1 Tax=Oopsacas minuta TaxID=111878 RepID=A0AAV7JXD4_9METZ|nr:AP-1 complex subunit gamma-1 isoform X2 [Oopsacas minuta]